jgi:hypothetical protein
LHKLLAAHAQMRNVGMHRVHPLPTALRRQAPACIEQLHGDRLARLKRHVALLKRKPAKVSKSWAHHAGGERPHKGTNSAEARIAHREACACKAHGDRNGLDEL